MSDQESSSDEEFDVELDSDDEIAIILNVHLPQVSQNDAFNYLPDNFQYRSVSHDQFLPTNPISYPHLKFTLLDPEKEKEKEEKEKDEPKPWRDNPKTMPDYFNYGFTERVWEAYKYKQLTLRRLFSGRMQNGNRHRNLHKNKDHFNNNNNNNNNIINNKK
ncbi:hypothetical protein TRFO_39964 [Tritrichomonas foetus]|uniref:Pre-mRNA polyadenylation factor Fip1 domain-containing protein n=1 Tax=Tritrichomonas foetus TaxID=1144522 RepID=A0A1J4J3A4_9EUKA|nr:hypothetical protein TRFO_39964 [Tritrichomonas foetus]|eukprot:OHS93902.1 hypothetical protein TRFO_39964 [Tritrichomonas foetus]